MERRALTENEITDLLTDLDDWEVVDGKLHKEYKFANFNEAMGWMVRVGLYAEKINHHPEWFNVYSRVRVDLVTHDLGNVISTLDAAMARKMEAYAA